MKAGPWISQRCQSLWFIHSGVASHWRASAWSLGATGSILGFCLSACKPQGRCSGFYECLHLVWSHEMFPFFHFQALSFPLAVTSVIALPCKTRSPRSWLNLGRFSVPGYSWLTLLWSAFIPIIIFFPLVPAVHWVWFIFTLLARQTSSKTERKKKAIL